MNYPVWQLDFSGGGLLIALIAILHVYISHFAIGGGLFLVLTEIKGYREDSQAILDYTRKHTKFFLLLTLMLGAMTGGASGSPSPSSPRPPPPSSSTTLFLPGPSNGSSFSRRSWPSSSTIKPLAGWSGAAT